MLLDLESEINELKSKLTYQELRTETLIQELFSLRKDLSESRKNYIDLYNYNPSAYFTIDNNYLIQALNFQASIMLGIDRQSLHNKLFLNYISSNSKAILQEKIQTLLNTKFKQTCSLEVLARGGELKYIFMECILLKNNLIRLCLTDNTENHHLKNQNDILKNSLNLINNLFKEASDPLASLDKELNLNVVNESFSELFSKIIATKIGTGMNLIKVLADYPELKTKIVDASQNALREKKVEIIIENSVKNIAVYYYYKLCIHSIYNQDNQKLLIFRIKDLTDYKLEERIKQKQQLEIGLSCRTSAMGEMASALAHEINQPLTVIATYSRSCLFILNNKSTVKKLKNDLLIPLEKIAVQAELAGEIIHNMKNFMRHDNFYVEETDINQLIKDTLSIFQYELLDFKLKITLNLMDDLPKIMTNKIHIMQVILNLARNSIEAFQSVSENNPELTIETTKSLNHINIHVRDNGPGIPYKFRNNILNTYFTTKSKGTGIGLGICRTLIEEHGGKLSLQNQEKNGAWFMFSLPINLAEQSNNE